MVDFKDEIMQYKSVSGKLDSLFTIMAYNITRDQLIENLNHQLKKVKNMAGSSLKKKTVNNRLFDTIKSLEEFKEENMKHILFVGEEVSFLEIPRKMVAMLTEYHVEKYFFNYDNVYDIEALVDIFFNMDLFPLIRIQKHHIDYFHLNRYKQKLVEAASVKTYDELCNFIKGTNKDNGLVHGLTNIISDKDKNNMESKWVYQKKNMLKDEIIEYFENAVVYRAHKEVQEVLAELSNPAKEHLFVFGKHEDIISAIESYQLKELYCHPKTLEEIKSRVDDSCLNFNIIKVPSLSKGDMGDTLLNSYNGAFGISYY